MTCLYRGVLLDCHHQASEAFQGFPAPFRCASDASPLAALALALAVAAGDFVVLQITDNHIYAEAEASNYHDILQRQEMIRGFWVPPSPAFAKKEAARQALEAKLRLLSL